MASGLGVHWLEGALKDARYAWRNLCKSRGYASAALVTLALAIGANSAIFSAVHAVLLKPGPIHQPDQLVVAWGADSARSPVIELSYRTIEHWAAHSRSFTHVAAAESSTWPVILEEPGEPVRRAESQLNFPRVSSVELPSVTAARLWRERGRRDGGDARNGRKCSARSAARPGITRSATVEGFTALRGACTPTNWPACAFTEA